MTNLIEKYNQASPIVLPYYTTIIRNPDDTSIPVDLIGGPCSFCPSNRIWKLRGTIKEYSKYQNIDFDFGGTCPKCHNITFFKFRWYPFQKRMVQITPDNTIDYDTGKITIVDIIRRFFYRICAFGQNDY
ncbi:MAG: hypothetical protein GY874_05990 [Desulfobacteraceae bacterium]|nr:hypothetical protein [Desulfobacteraceae bacterium]